MTTEWCNKRSRIADASVASENVSPHFDSGIFKNNISALYNNVGTNLNELFDHIFGAIKK